ncbi:MAG: hypothetical protein P1R58_10160 [bacterium]|nr:hypothetical protein [bacterium]
MASQDFNVDEKVTDLVINRVNEFYRRYRSAAIVAALLILSLFATVDQAEAINSPLSFSAGGGMTRLSTFDNIDFAWKDGIHYTAGIGIELLPLLNSSAKLEYHRLPFDWGKAGLPDFSGNDLRVITFGIEGRLSISSPKVSFQPHLILGAGFARLSVSDRDDLPGGFTGFVPDVENMSKGYIEYGVGLDMPFVSFADLFIQFRQIRFRTAVTTSTLQPLSIGLRF